MQLPNFQPLLALICCLCSSALYALPQDKSQPIHIQADHAEIDEKKGTITYTGKVRMTQGSMQINASQVQLFRNQKQVTRIIATGKPANFRQQPQDDQPVTDAFGKKLDYSIAKQTVTITGDARVQQNADSFSSERIVYHMDEAIVNAYSGENGTGQRVKMVIQPKADQ